jgi:hypothetical protein
LLISKKGDPDDILFFLEEVGARRALESKTGERPRVKAASFTAAQEVHDLLEEALPSIEPAARVLTPQTELDDEIVRTLALINVRAGDVLAREKRSQSNTLLDLGTEILIGRVERKIAETGEVKIGATRIVVPDQVRALGSSLFRAAIDYGYRVVARQLAAA